MQAGSIKWTAHLGLDGFWTPTEPVDIRALQLPRVWCPSLRHALRTCGQSCGEKSPGTILNAMLNAGTAGCMRMCAHNAIAHLPCRPRVALALALILTCTSRAVKYEVRPGRSRGQFKIAAIDVKYRYGSLLGHLNRPSGGRQVIVAIQAASSWVAHIERGL